MSRTGKLSLRSLKNGALLEHDWNAILHRIVAATTLAMQPRVRGAVWTGDEGVVTYRANDNVQQGLGENRLRHLQSVDPFTMSAWLGFWTEPRSPLKSRRK